MYLHYVNILPTKYVLELGKIGILEVEEGENKKFMQFNHVLF
jgi:hypothetical protein